VLVMTLPVAHAVEATRLFAAECPSTRVIALSLSESLDPAPLLDAGAAAYVRDSESFNALFAAIRHCGPPTLCPPS
jgi:DNA-binding NarL/FixJ family response regulator